MSKDEEIAQWLETLHCENWKDGLCFKPNCLLFRELANDIRAKFYS